MIEKIMTKEEQERIQIQDTIDESGCQIIQIPGDNYMPPYAYTIGLFQQFNHPEIICFGLSEDVMFSLLTNAKDRIEEDNILETSETYQGFLEKDFEVSFIEVNPTYYNDYLPYATWFYSHKEFPVIQLVWPDKKQLFPWNKKFDKKLEFIQPLLDRNIEFRFLELRELSVFATNRIIHDGATTKYVVHDEEGDWFFMESDDDDSDDLEIVSLDKLVKLDPTLNSIYHLQYGWEAYRNSTDSEWEEREEEIE